LLNIDKYYRELPWLSSQRKQFEATLTDDRFPHALLLHGIAGSGRRQLALWVAETLLNTSLESAGSEAGMTQASTPDLRTVVPQDDKKLIGIDQIRELIEFMNLTSHGKRRCAIIYPADSMTVNAANSLLKTLEEPAADAIVILICESLSRLPATVVSRCQHLRINPPSEAVALKWLKQQSQDGSLATLLEFSGGAPLAALALANADFARQAAEFDADLDALTDKQADPVGIATKWAKQPDLALRWLYRCVAQQLRHELTTRPAGAAGATEPVLGYFRQLDQIRELRRFIGGGVSAELSLTELLMNWYGAGSHTRER
jgi:DNA polymerase-3 subunit delta'